MIRIIGRFLFILLCLWTSAGCHSNNKAVFQEEVKLWRVEYPGDDDCSYIFGVCHILPSTFIDSIPELPSVLHYVNSLVMEVTTLDKQPISIDYPTTLPDNVEYESLFNDKDSYNMFVDFLLDHHLMSYHFSRLSPPFLYLLILQQMLKDSIPEQNHLLLEQHLETIMKEDGKEIVFLESPTSQINQLYSVIRKVSFQDCKMSLEEQMTVLLDLIRSYDLYIRASLNYFKDYNNLTVTGYYAYSDFLTGDYPLDTAKVKSINDALLTQRTKAWVQPIINHIRTQSSLIVVGDAHLWGDAGLLAALQKKGFVITPCK